VGLAKSNSLLFEIMYYDYTCVKIQLVCFV